MSVIWIVWLQFRKVYAILCFYVSMSLCMVRKLPNTLKDFLHFTTENENLNVFVTGWECRSDPSIFV